jgi:hypothetical protein
VVTIGDVNHSPGFIMPKSLSLSVVLLCLCLGCGTGEYESRIGQHRGGSAAAAGPSLLGPAEDVSGTRVTIHAPLGMTLAPQGGDSKRAKPFPFPVPGAQQRIYEGFVTDSQGGQTPFYCNIITLDISKVAGLDPMGMMKGAAAKAPGAPQFSEIQATSPEGKESKWQTARHADKDEFYYKSKDGKENFQQMDDIEEIYVQQESGFFVMIAWRLPSHIEPYIGGEGVGLGQLAKAVAGGVTVKPQ